MHVTFDANGKGQFSDGSVLTNMDVNHQTMTVPQLPKVDVIPKNMHFIGWTTEKDGTGQIFDHTTVVKENITVYAQYAYLPVNVIFQNEDNYIYNEQKVEYGKDAIAPNTELVTKEGYTFTGWDKPFTNVKEDLVVTAKFKANTYTVTFDGNGATSGEMDDQTFTYDKTDKLNKNTYKKEDHTFIGWEYNGKTYTDEEEIKNLVSSANGNVVFKAKWQENDSYTVLFQDDQGNELKTQTVYVGKDAKAPADPKKEGYTFTGWDKPFTNVKEDLVVTAKFKANTYTVTFDGNGATSGEMDDQTFTYDQVDKLSKNTYQKEDHRFIGWEYNGKTYTDEEEIKNLVSSANGNVVFKAKWQENDSYTVLFQDDEGNELKTQTVYVGKDAKAPTDPKKEGYTFTGWDKPFTNVKEDLVVTAKFEANTYTVTFDGNGATSGEMDDQTFIYDQADKLSKNTYQKEDHTFIGWEYNGKTYTDEEEIKNLVSSADENVVFTARWQENDIFTVLFQDDEGNTLKTESVYVGKDATAPTDIEKEGYTFIGWDIDFTNVTKDLVVTAQYSKDEVVVRTVNVTFIDYDGTVLKTEVIEVGSDATAPTNPFRLGYIFAGWDRTYTNVTEDILVMATYSIDAPIVGPEDPITPEGPTIAPIAPLAPTVPTPVVTPPVVVTPTPVVTPPVVTPPVVQPVQPEEQTPINPDQVGNEEIIEDQEVPLGTIEKSWALVNLICTVLTVVAGIFLIISKTRKEEEEEETETTNQYKRRVWTKIAGAVVGIVSVIAFILTEDITLPMQYVDKWTMVMVALVLVQGLVVLIGRKWKDDNEQEESVTA